MASTHFTTGTTITSEWLNDVNDAVYEGNITAEGVQYTPPFTGGITETVEAKLAETVSVKDFGAVGDGVTDDTQAFQDATDTGYNVYVPETTNSYSVTALTDEQRRALYGPGIVELNNVVVTINSVASAFSNNLPNISVYNNDQQPVEYFAGLKGSVGLGAFTAWTDRTAGYGAYGNILNNSYVSAPLGINGVGEFDSGITSWVNASDMVAFSAVYGFWGGSNTPAKNLGQTYNAGVACAMELNAGNRWGNFGLQTDIGGTNYTVGLQLVPDVLPARDGQNSIAVTVASGTPAVVTLSSHGFMTNMGVVFTGAGTLPSGLSKGTTYYVVGSTITTDTFSVSATPGGSAINTTGSASGALSVIPSWPGNFAQATAHSIWGHQWWVGNLIRQNTICKDGYAYLTVGGSNAATAGGAYSKVTGYWTEGLDFANATLVNGVAIQLANSQAITWNGTSMSGTATTFGLSIASGVGEGGLYANNYAQNSIRWGSDGSNPTLCFFGGGAITKPTVSGAKAGNAALTSLVAALTNLGLITNATS